MNGRRKCAPRDEIRHRSFLSVEPGDLFRKLIVLVPSRVERKFVGVRVVVEELSVPSPTHDRAKQVGSRVARQALGQERPNVLSGTRDIRVGGQVPHERREHPERQDSRSEEQFLLRLRRGDHAPSNFGQPNANVFTGPTAGQITTLATPPRQIQLALKLIF